MTPVPPLRAVPSAELLICHMRVFSGPDWLSKTGALGTQASDMFSLYGIVRIFVIFIPYGC